MYKISKEFSFAASHALAGLPDSHLCSRLHGHNYIVIVELQSESLNEVGFVVDYRALEPIKQIIDKFFDHRHLNDIEMLDGINPTAENLAKFFFDYFRNSFPNLSAVTVKETEKTAARYELK